jgi:hypothetical protein
MRGSRPKYVRQKLFFCEIVAGHERDEDRGSLYADSVEQAAAEAAYLIHGHGIVVVERLTGLGGQSGWFQAYGDARHAAGPHRSWWINPSKRPSPAVKPGFLLRSARGGVLGFKLRTAEIVQQLFQELLLRGPGRCRKHRLTP